MDIRQTHAGIQYSHEKITKATLKFHLNQKIQPLAVAMKQHKAS